MVFHFGPKPVLFVRFCHSLYEKEENRKKIYTLYSLTQPDGCIPTFSFVQGRKRLKVVVS